MNDILLVWVFLLSLPVTGDTKSFVFHDWKRKSLCWIKKKAKISFLFPSQFRLSERFMAWQPCKLIASSYPHNTPSTKCAIMSLQMLPQLCTWRINFDWTLQSSLQVWYSSSLSLSIEYFTIHINLNHQTLHPLLLSTVNGETRF